MHPAPGHAVRALTPVFTRVLPPNEEQEAH